LFRSSRDLLLVAVLRSLAVVSGLIVVLIAVFLVRESRPALSHIGFVRFLADESWHPAAEGAVGTFNLLPIVLGTLLTSAGAIALATPLGILSAAFVQFHASPRVARWYRRMVELMAGVPSVVYGLWGLVVLVPLVARVHPPGQSLLTAVVILTMMILPTVALLSHAAFAALPPGLLLGSAALGMSRTTTTFFVMVPAARSGLVTAVLLGLVRAVGETMAVLMVCGNVVRVPRGPFDPVRTITATIALEMGYAVGDHRSALFLCGLVLLLFVAGLVAVAEIVSRGKLHGTA
jgi:phosphate transport system permease protein